MGIADDDIERVRRDTDIVGVISSYTQLKRVGRRFVGLCPFHSERSPSFSVNAEEGLYYCFGCQAKGDAITFVREKEHQDFVGAVEMLAAKANITLHYTTADEGESRKRRARLLEAVDKAVDWYHNALINSPDAGAARGYLRQRGYDGEVVRQYRLGWAPEGWDRLSRALRLPNDILTDSGLGFINRRGSQQDAFRARVMFPIFNDQGAAVGFGGRILPGGEGSKYKNSSESTIYAKSRLLYGLNWAKTGIVEADEVVVCEGYTDVIAFGAAGLPRAVATCGTALTDEHVKLLRRFARRVVLAFDADSAGQEAAARFYEWEQAHDLDVAVADLPPGVDPGELGQKDPQGLAKAIANARPFLKFRVDRVLEAGRMETVEGRARAAEDALTMIREHPDPLVRDEYAVEVASRTRLDVGLVRKQLATRRAPTLRAATSGRPDRSFDGEYPDGPELEALRLAAGGDEEICGLVLPELFTNELYGTAFVLLSRSDSVHEALSEAGPELGELLMRLSVEESSVDASDVAARLWQPFVRRLMVEVKDELGAADRSQQAAILHEHTWLRLCLEQLNDVSRRAPTIEELLGWIHGRNEEDS